MVYTSSSDSTGRAMTPAAEVLVAVDDVCRGVAAAWLVQTTAAEQQRVRRDRPFIPSDLDRTLLTDLSARLGVYDIDEATKYALRARFWEVLAED